MVLPQFFQTNWRCTSVLLYKWLYSSPFITHYKTLQITNLHRHVLQKSEQAFTFSLFVSWFQCLCCWYSLYLYNSTWSRPLPVLLSVTSNTHLSLCFIYCVLFHVCWVLAHSWGSKRSHSAGHCLHGGKPDLQTRPRCSHAGLLRGGERLFPQVSHTALCYTSLIKRRVCYCGIQSDVVVWWHESLLLLSPHSNWSSPRDSFLLHHNNLPTMTILYLCFYSL